MASAHSFAIRFDATQTARGASSPLRGFCHLEGIICRHRRGRSFQPRAQAKADVEYLGQIAGVDWRSG